MKKDFGFNMKRTRLGEISLLSAHTRLPLIWLKTSTSVSTQQQTDAFQLLIVNVTTLSSGGMMIAKKNTKNKNDCTVHSIEIELIIIE